MGRSPCCAKEGLNRGAWTAHEDKILAEYIRIHGEGRWRNLPKQAGLKRCGKSCRLRWLNYLRPDIKRGNISSDEEELIVRLHKLLGNRWSLIAGRLPGRTDNEIKNYWNTNLVKRFKDQHHQTNTSSRGLSKQKPNEKNSRNIPKSQVITPKNKSLPSPSSSPSPSPPKLIRTKTTRATKVFINPNLHSTMKFQQKISKTEEQQQEVFPEPLRVDSAVNSISCTNQLETNNYDNEFSTDLLIDFNMGEISLSDLLNSDFSDVCDFSYCNNNSDVDLSSLMFSNEMLQDWTQSNFDESNVGSNDVHSFTSFLESKHELLEE